MFTETVDDQSGRSVPPRIPRKTPSRTPARSDEHHRVVAAVARSWRTSPSALVSTDRRSAREALARHVAMYLLHVVFAQPPAVIAARFGRHRTSVHYACARIEDRRDDPDFDRRLRALEQRLAGGRP